MCPPSPAEEQRGSDHSRQRGRNQKNQPRNRPVFLCNRSARNQKKFSPERARSLGWTPLWLSPHFVHLTSTPKFGHFSVSFFLFLLPLPSYLITPSFLSSLSTLCSRSGSQDYDQRTTRTADIATMAAVSKRIADLPGMLLAFLDKYPKTVQDLKKPRMLARLLITFAVLNSLRKVYVHMQPREGNRQSSFLWR